MPLQTIQNQFLTVFYDDGRIEKKHDNLFNRVSCLKDTSCKDVVIQSGIYIKKDFDVIHTF